MMAPDLTTANELLLRALNKLHDNTFEGEDDDTDELMNEIDAHLNQHHGGTTT